MSGFDRHVKSTRHWRSDQSCYWKMKSVNIC